MGNEAWLGLFKIVIRQISVWLKPDVVLPWLMLQTPDACHPLVVCSPDSAALLYGEAWRLILMAENNHTVSTHAKEKRTEEEGGREAKTNRKGGERVRESKNRQGQRDRE